MSLVKEEVVLPSIGQREILVKTTCSLLYCPKDPRSQDSSIKTSGSAAREVAGIVEKVGPMAKKFRVKDHVFGYILSEGNASGLAKYCVLDEELATKCDITNSEFAVALLRDYTKVQLMMSKLPSFPAQHSVLILGAETPLSHVAIHCFRSLKCKVILYTTNGSEVSALKAKHPDLAVFSESPQGIVTDILEETYQIGVSVVVDIPPSGVDDPKFPSKSKLVECLTVGGSIITMFPSSFGESNIHQVLHNKSASLCYHNLETLLQCMNFFGMFSGICERLTDEIKNHNLRPTLVQRIKFDEVGKLLSSENLEALSTNYRVVITY